MPEDSLEDDSEESEEEDSLEDESLEDESLEDESLEDESLEDESEEDESLEDEPLLAEDSADDEEESSLELLDEDSDDEESDDESDDEWAKERSAATREHFTLKCNRNEVWQPRGMRGGTRRSARVSWWAARLACSRRKRARSDALHRRSRAFIHGRPHFLPKACHALLQRRELRAKGPTQASPGQDRV